jgi:DTW domain-containing protein
LGKRSKNSQRCLKCRMHVPRCICDYIPTIHLETHLVVVMHRREFSKPTATAPLAVEALTNSQLYLHGNEDSPLNFEHLNKQDRRVLLLFPSDKARVLDEALLKEDTRPITLVVPDGNWGQAKRISKRVPGLEQTEHVVLPVGKPTSWRIRSEPQENGLATFEAIARSLGIIESKSVEITLMQVFDRMVATILATRNNKD